MENNKIAIAGIATILTAMAGWAINKILIAPKSLEKSLNKFKENYDGFKYPLVYEYELNTNVAVLIIKDLEPELQQILFKHFKDLYSNGLVCKGVRYDPSYPERRVRTFGVEIELRGTELHIWSSPIQVDDIMYIFHSFEETYHEAWGEKKSDKKLYSDIDEFRVNLGDFTDTELSKLKSLSSTYKIHKYLINTPELPDKLCYQIKSELINEEVMTDITTFKSYINQLITTYNRDDQSKVRN